MAYKQNRENDEVHYEIVEKIATLSTNPRGWSKEINLIAWNNGSAKYDLREWNPTHETMSRGITLSPFEMRTLVETLSGRDFDAEMRRGKKEARAEEAVAG